MEDAQRDPTQDGEAHDTRYAAFLLRVWHKDASGEWRLVIEEIGSEARHGFTDWESLVNHVRTAVEHAPQK